MQVKATGGDITVDAFLIFVAEQHAAALAHAEHFAHLVDDSIAVVGGILAYGDVEGEHPQPLCAQHLGNFQRVAQLLKMGGKIAGLNIDLADGRADGPGTQPRVVQLAAHLFGLFQGNGGDVLAVYPADFQAVQPIAAHRRNLAVDGGGCFISKRVNSHGEPPLRYM